MAACTSKRRFLLVARMLSPSSVSRKAFSAAGAAAAALPTRCHVAAQPARLGPVTPYDTSGQGQRKLHAGHSTLEFSTKDAMARSRTTGRWSHKCAKSDLHELCGERKWAPPVFFYLQGSGSPSQKTVHNFCADRNDR